MSRIGSLSSMSPAGRYGGKGSFPSVHALATGADPYETPATDNDGTDDYGNPLYGTARPAALHTIAQGAQSGAHLTRMVGRALMGYGGGSGGSGGAGGGGGSSGGVSVARDNYLRRITGTSPDMVGPVQAPTALQSVRGGVNQIGLRGGLMVAQVGLSALAETTGAMAAEDDAANGQDGSNSGGNALAYLKAQQQQEYSGIRGGARYYANTAEAAVGRAFGYKSETPAQQEAELAAAAEKEAETQQQVVKAQRAGKVINRVQDQQRHADEREGERAAEASAGSTEEKDRLKSSFGAKRAKEADDERYSEEEAALRQQVPAGQQSSPQFLKRIAEVELRRKASADVVDKAKAAEGAERDKQRDERVDTVRSEAAADRQELGGDTQGAERTKLDAKLRKGQADADRRSPEEGKAFAGVADAERAGLADKQNRERVELREKTSDEVNDAGVKAKEASLAADGKAYEADTLEFAHAQDEKIAKLRQVQDATVDTAKRAAIGEQITAAEKANRSERESRDRGHAREDREQADDVRAGTAAEALRDSGQGAKADALQRLQRDNDEVRRAHRDGRPEDEKAAREKRDYDRERSAYREMKEQNGRDRVERDADLRGKGQGALAEYDDFRDRVADQIREATESGDPKRLAQAKRTGAAELKAYEQEHRHRAELMSADDYDDKLLTADWNSHGEALARASNAQDIKDFNGGKGDLKPADAGSAALGVEAKKLGAVAGLWEKALANAVKIAIAE